MERKEAPVWFIIASLSALTFGFSGFFMKVSSARQGSLPHLLWGLYCTGTLGFLFWMIYTHDFAFTLPFLIGGLIIGLGSAAGNWFFMKALDHGPASLTAPLLNINIILIIGMSMLLYDEQLSVIEGIGVILLIIAISLIPIDPDEKLAIRDRRWYLLLFFATLLFTFRNGGLKVTEELGLSGTIILFYGYLASLIWFSVELLIRSRMKVHAASFGNKAQVRTGLTWGLIAGIFSWIGMQLYAIALELGPASIVAPLFATNSLVIALLSILIFRERLSKLQILALCCLMIGIVLLRI